MRRGRVLRAHANRAWEVRQVYGEGKVLLDQLREVAALLEEGFGGNPVTLLNGLVQKVRWSAGNFICLVAKGAEEEIVGACDLTLLPAGGPKKPQEALVKDVATDLGLDESDHFAYLTGMVVPVSYRRQGIGQALLAKSEAISPKMTPAPACIALHVDESNAAARALYSGAGFEEAEQPSKGQSAGFQLPFQPKTRPKVLMVKWLPPPLED